MSVEKFLHWKPSAEHLARKLPVTVISGFLGAGKTTLLNHLLREPGNRKIAVIVNDLGEVNIDASLIREGAKQMEGSELGAMKELTSGCICCSIRTDLADALVEILETYQPDHLVIEATGAAEPLSIAETLYATNAEGFSLQDVSFINNLVTIIDSQFMAGEWALIPKGRLIRRQRILQSDPRKPLIELLIEQAECADVLLLNKTDLLEEDDVERLRGALADLNPHAEILTCRESEVSPGEILDRARFVEEETVGGARWRKVITEHLKAADSSSGRPTEVEESEERVADHSHCDHEHGHCEHSHGHDDHDHDHDHHEHHHHKDYGLDTFLYTARRPFREKQLFKILRSSFPGLVRAKGFFWTRENNDRVGMLSLAGNVLRADFVGTWWAAMLEQGEASIEERPEIVGQIWDEETGDRRQELVFIGIDLPEEEIRKTLNKALD